MNRRTAIRRMAIFFLTTASLSEAQQPKKVPRIGYLSAFDAARDSARAEAIRLALRERGYIEGQNIATEYRYSEGKSDRLPELAAELVRLKVDIILVAGGTGPVRAAKNATKTIPIVMTGGGVDPVEAGIIESLAQPRREAAGAAQRSGYQSCPCRVSLRSCRSGQCTRHERGSPSRGACAAVDSSALGDTSCGRYRQDVCCDGQAAPGWTLRVRGWANE
ncbi:MAG: hypothetical protein HW419_567 [Deltaproteobacteria bacterium]|nr:hypothetical protein [Deltaproteobacteria bacterium]